MGVDVDFAVSSYDDPNEFLDLVGDLLAQNETKNNLILGGLAMGLKKNLRAYSETMPLMALVRDGLEI